jgi:hypothetical protein
MVSMKIEPPIDQQVKQLLDEKAQQIKRSIKSAADTAAENILERGRADISGAGRFGARWTDGLTAPVTEEADGIVITVREAVPYWRVFEYGATIKGKPLLWIPLSFAVEAQGVRASDFPGRLFRVDRKSGGAPLLLSADDKQPKYFAKESVTIPKKFHLVEIIQDVAHLLGALYRVSMRTGK